MIYGIHFTKDEPHWSIAFIEADSEQEAVSLLVERLKDKPETVWDEGLLPPGEWRVWEQKRPFSFVLGQGCR